MTRPIFRGFYIVALALTAVAVGVGRAGAQVNTAAVEALLPSIVRASLFPPVIVRLTSVESGSKREEITDDDGSARVGALPPGDCNDVTFEFPDGTRLLQKDVSLLVGQTAVLHATKQAAIEHDRGRDGGGADGRSPQSRFVDQHHP